MQEKKIDVSMVAYWKVSVDLSRLVTIRVNFFTKIDIFSNKMIREETQKGSFVWKKSQLKKNLIWLIFESVKTLTMIPSKWVIYITDVKTLASTGS